MTSSEASTSAWLCAGGDWTGWPAPLRRSGELEVRVALHVVEDAGHVPHIEQPEAFLKALAAAPWSHD
jgi:pimeloyl-ACP methyl ester carboxylesterase